MAIGAFIGSCTGYSLSPEEEAFFNRTDPFGLILFKRNCESPEQVSKLTESFRQAVGRKDAPVFIDQEGGRVQRMGPPVPEWRRYPSAALFGLLHDRNPMLALRAARLVGRLMARDLFDVGISADCLPVLDLPQPGSSAVISDRAYSSKPDAVLALARAHTAGLMEGGVIPVMKHIPGHGRATVDSHHELPVVKASRSMLEAHDFYPFAGFGDCPMAMTAHVIYENIDPNRPATQSRDVIRNVIRKQLGYNGFLMTDDLSMKALRGSLGDRAAASLAAGVDIVLYCSGVLSEMEEVAAASGALKGKSLARAKAALRSRRKPLPFDEKMALRDLGLVLEQTPTA
ncbi:MAG: beta-N-acetylhexosaminidase [Proteobacteria bacterium]|nr:beta-N-acetylhexosaminidase [Pseudomonadota bacterium]